LFHKYNNVYIIVGTLLCGVALAQDNKAHTLFIYLMPESIKLSIHSSVHELKFELFKFKAEKRKISSRCPGNFLKISGSLLAQTG
jgi:hypothetical protein